MTLKDILPFLIPLIIVEFALLAYTFHQHYKRGNRVLWIIVTLVGMEFIGPVLYFVLGKEDN